MASLRGVRRRVCGKKVKYETAADATRAAKLVSSKTGEWFRAYPCSWCGQYHIGHPPSDIHKRMLERLVGRTD